MSERELAARLIGNAELALALDPPPPEKVGRYEVLAPLGRGATSDVWRAKDPLLGREVALKLLLAAAPDALQRFQQEVQLLAALSHPNIVPIHDAGVDEGRPWFVMELIEGGPLDLAALSIDELAHHFEAVARALAAAHARGVVHRDLKPQNLLVDARGPRVADFGVAKLQGATGADSGALVGTLPYMAPEQLRGNEVGPPADVWALGVMLHEGLTGRVPFAGGTLEELFVRALAGPAPVRTLRPEVPAGLEALVLATLSANAVERPSAEEVAERLSGMRARGARGGALWGAFLALAALLAICGALVWIWATSPAARIARACGAIDLAARVNDRVVLESRAGELEVLLLDALRPEERHEALAALGAARVALGQSASARRALDEALLVPGPRAAASHLRRALLGSQGAVLSALREDDPWLGWREDLARARQLGLAPADEPLAAALEALGAAFEDDEDDPPRAAPGDDALLLLLAGEREAIAGDDALARTHLERARVSRPDLAAAHAALALLREHEEEGEAARAPARERFEAALRAVSLDPELGGPALGHLLRLALLAELRDAPRLAPLEGLAHIEARLVDEPVARASLLLFLATRTTPVAPAALERALDLLEAASGSEPGVETETALALCELLQSRAFAALGREEEAGQAWQDAHDRIGSLSESGSDQLEIERLEALLE